MKKETVDPVRAFQQAMSMFAAGVTAITTMSGNQPVGLIATSVCSLSSDPPSIIVCVNRSASAHDAIVEAGRFAVNLLSTDHCEVVDRFREAKGHERFDAAQWTTLRTGAPVLTDATVVLDCTVGGQHDGFTHSIFVGVIEQISLSDAVDSSCLLWHGRGFAKSTPLRLSAPSTV